VVDLARKILFYDKLRFLITVAGVGFAVALVLVQTGLFLGLIGNASGTIDHMDADIWVAAKNTPNIDFARTFSDAYVNRVRSVNGVLRADNLVVWFIRMALPNGAQEGIEVYGMERSWEWNLPWSVAEGDPRDLKRGRYLILDDSATLRCGPFAVGQHREMIGTRLKIIGRSREAISFTTAPVGIADLRTVQDLSPELHGQTTYIVVKLQPGADVRRVAAEIQRRLPYMDVHTTAEWSWMSRSYWVKSTGLGLNLFMSIFLGCLIAVMVVAQTLYTSTVDHLKEFGTIKAIGGSNGDIYRVLAKQAAIAGVTGFVAGAGLTLGMRPALMRAHLTLVTLPGLWAATFAGTLLFCLIAAVVSFRKVANLDPAMVFRG
jgi:putative ABC transport system permease protein